MRKGGGEDSELDNAVGLETDEKLEKAGYNFSVTSIRRGIEFQWMFALIQLLG